MNKENKVRVNNNYKVKNKSKFMKGFYTNADQILNKKEDLFLQGSNTDIIMITEMIPKQQKNKIPLAMLHLEGYEMYINFNPEDENLGTTGIRGTGNNNNNRIYFMSIIHVKK